MERRTQPDFLRPPLPVFSCERNCPHDLLILRQCERNLCQASLILHSADQIQPVNTPFLYIQFEGHTASSPCVNLLHRQAAACLCNRNPHQFSEGFHLPGGNGSKLSVQLTLPALHPLISGRPEQVSADIRPL